jgi:hypothetical protein
MLGRKARTICASVRKQEVLKPNQVLKTEPTSPIVALGYAPGPSIAKGFLYLGTGTLPPPLIGDQHPFGLQESLRWQSSDS